jgi:TPR repeat protein
MPLRVSADSVLAAKYFKIAADQNHAEAQFHNGSRLSSGAVVSRDLVGAAAYFKPAADSSFAEA